MTANHLHPQPGTPFRPRLALRALTLAVALALPGLAAAQDVQIKQFEWPAGLSQEQVVMLDQVAHAQTWQALDATAAKALASRLSQALRHGGYPVATVVVTEEDWAKVVSSGVFKPHVFLGEVGRIDVNRNTSEANSGRLQRTVERALCGGSGLPCVITSAGLERAQLLLQDTPGVQVQSLGLSSQGVGLGQTAVEVGVSSSGPRLSGHASADNYGVPSSGSNRVGADAEIDNLLHEGDIWQIGAMTTSKKQNTGLLSASIPVGISGLRGQFDASRTVYTLPQVNATGTAVSGSAGLTYPVVRGLDRNWIVGLSYYNVLSEQEVGGITASAPTHLQGLKLSLTADDGDRPKALGDSYWSASSALSSGRDRQNLQVADPTGTVGPYTKLVVSTLGKQMLGSGWYLLGNARAQLASDNLNSYEAMGVGGVGGVRAFSSSEGSLTDGVYLSGELRHLVSLGNAGQFAPGVWIDYINGDVLRHPYSGWQTNMGYANATMSNHRALRGWGLGLDWEGNHGLRAGVTVGWKLPGSPDSAVQPGSASTRVLASLGLKF